MKHIKFLVIAPLAAAMMGCASTNDSIVLEDAGDAQLEALVHATRDIQRRWGVTSRLSSLKFKDSPPVLDVSRLDDSMRRVMAFPGGYQGTLENMLVELASLSGYDYLQPAGKKPIRGIPIVFDEEYRTLAEYIYDAGVQAGSRAKVTLDMGNKTIQVAYAGF